jgi:hypothetical protein
LRWRYNNEYGKSRVLNQCVPTDSPMNDPEVRARHAAVLQTPEYRAKQAEGARRTALDPEWQSKHEAALAKHYVLRDPDGNRVEVYNLNAFCRERGLNQGAMANVTLGTRNHHKGWTLYHPE